MPREAITGTFSEFGCVLLSIRQTFRSLVVTLVSLFVCKSLWYCRYQRPANQTLVVGDSQRRHCDGRGFFDSI